MQAKSLTSPVAGLVLAAGAGSRLAPLTRERPKPLCPVAGTALVDGAIERVRAGVGPDADVVVNAHHGADLVIDHLRRRARAAGGVVAVIGDPGVDRAGAVRGAQRVWVSHERRRALGTAGAVGHLADWLDGRGVVVVNADAWTTAAVSGLLDRFDGTTASVLVVGDGFGPRAKVAAAVVPWADVVRLPDTPAGLYEHLWSPRHAAGALDVVTCGDVFIDCGTPADYLAANMAATGGVSWIGDGARVDGTVHRSVVWPGATVAAGEHLVDAVRTTAGRTVLVRFSDGGDHPPGLRH